MTRPKILVIGSTNTDMVVDVPALPSAGQTVLGGAFRMTPGGKGANQAVAAARAGRGGHLHHRPRGRCVRGGKPAALGAGRHRDALHRQQTGMPSGRGADTGRCAGRKYHRGGARRERAITAG